jgi:hypothetical protein
MKTTHSGRERLSTQSLPGNLLETPPVSDDYADPTPHGEGEGDFFFDQDAH